MDGATPKPKNKPTGMRNPNSRAKSNRPYEIDYATPSPKRQRTTRASTTGKTMSYDMRYHPMDDILRPAASAARKAAHGLDTRRSSTTSDSATFVDDTEGSDDEEDEYLRAPPRTCALDAESFASPPRRPVPPRSGSPSGRRITRAELNGEKPVLYDMKHHPMDLVTRPAAAKRVYEKYSSFSNDACPGLIHVSQSSKTGKGKRKNSKAYKHASTQNIADDSDGAPHWDTSAATPVEPKTSSSAADLTGEQGMIPKPATSLWKSVSNLERLLYLLQKGAPADSATLPMSWYDEAQALQAASAIDGTSPGVGFDLQVEAVRDQYADLHHKLQEDFGADEEPSEMEDWTLHYAEDFDVYNLEMGDKYFKHRNNHVVQEPFHRACDWIICKPKAASRNDIVENASDRSNGTPKGTNADAEAQAESHDESRECMEDGHLSGESEVPTANEEVGDLQYPEDLLARREASATGFEIADSEDDHRLGGSYNDAEGYLRQSRGEQDDDHLADDNFEDELIAAMWNSGTSLTGEVMEIGELAPMFSSSSGQNEDEDDELAAALIAEEGVMNSGLMPIFSASSSQVEDEEVTVTDGMFSSSSGQVKDEDGELAAGSIAEEATVTNGLVPIFSSSSGQAEDEDSEPVVQKRPLNRRSRNRTTEASFSVHEDEPGSTPRIKRQIALNPRSPGTDIPKENLVERSASEEYGS